MAKRKAQALDEEEKLKRARLDLYVQPTNRSSGLTLDRENANKTIEELKDEIFASSIRWKLLEKGAKTQSADNKYQRVTALVEKVIANDKRISEKVQLSFLIVY